MSSAFGAARLQPKPPEKGVFPLDHDKECHNNMKKFINCIKENNNNHYPCKNLSKEYLECRMNHNLMAKENFKNLGFNEGDEEGVYIQSSSSLSSSEEINKEKKGFIAGMNVSGSKKWGSYNPK